MSAAAWCAVGAVLSVMALAVGLGWLFAELAAWLFGVL